MENRLAIGHTPTVILLTVKVMRHNPRSRLHIVEEEEKNTHAAKSCQRGSYTAIGPLPSISLYVFPDRNYRGGQDCHLFLFLLLCYNNIPTCVNWTFLYARKSPPSISVRKTEKTIGQHFSNPVVSDSRVCRNGDAIPWITSLWRDKGTCLFSPEPTAVPRIYISTLK